MLPLSRKITYLENVTSSLHDTRLLYLLLLSSVNINQTISFLMQLKINLKIPKHVTALKHDLYASYKRNAEL